MKKFERLNRKGKLARIDEVVKEVMKNFLGELSDQGISLNRCSEKHYKSADKPLGSSPNYRD